MGPLPARTQAFTLSRGKAVLFAAWLLPLLAWIFAPQIQASTPPPQATPALRVALDNNYPPYCFLDEKGAVQGILVDRWRLWSQKTGIALDLQGLNWFMALDQMRNGDFDVIDTIFKTPERSVWLDFSPPHTRIDVPLFVNNEIEGVHDLASAKPFRIAAKAGDAAIEHLRREGFQAIDLYPNYEAIIMAAKAGLVSIFVADRPAALYYVHKHGIGNTFRQTPPISSGEFHRGYRRNSAVLMDRVESGFAAITPKEYEAIDERWLGPQSKNLGPDPRVLLKFILPVLLVALLLLVWVQMLRWQVGKRTQALSESEARFRESLESMPIPVGIADTSGNILLLNREFTACFGYTTADTPDMTTWIAKLYPDPLYRATAQARWAEDVALALAQGSSTPRRIYRLQAKDGSAHDVEIVMKPLGGLFLTTFNDVTERHRVEMALKKSEANYRLLHESMQDAYVRVDLSGFVLECNRAYLELLGYTIEELQRLTYRELTPERWHSFEARLIETQLLTRGFTDVYEKEYRKKDGTIIPVELRTFLLRDDEGRPKWMWAIVRDITERRQLEAQLLQAQKMEAIGQLAGGVAHDFNNILAAIMLNVSLLQSEAALPANVASSLRDVRGELDRAADLTRQLLAFGRRQALKVGMVDVSALISRSVRMLQRLLGEQIIIDDSGLAPLPAIAANAGMLEQVVMNLCLNARDAMPKGGTLTLASSVEQRAPEQLKLQPGVKAGEFIHLQIRDTGTGMSEELRSRIFEPFFTTKELGHGTGLGLSIVFGIVKQHGGWIDVESSPGCGSSFHVYFPTGTAPDAPRAASRPPMSMLRGHERILLVEDEAVVRKTLGVALERMGYSVCQAADPAEAFKVWEREQGRFDLLLTDMIMPGGMNGRELAEQLLVSHPALRVIISSGYHKELETGLSDKHAFAQLSKPYTVDQLSHKLRELLDPPRRSTA